MLICAQSGRVSGLVKKTDPASSARSKKDSDCTGVTLHRVANFRVKHLNSDIEQTRRGIVLLVLLYILRY